ncbi:MAG TPA: hypothetical protein P5304_26480 [Phycisphaerae bacterium]|nr:hypothetical protein [Phycisphaerae bacterium]
MSSRKQIAANRRNAQSSTGPQDTGRTSQNAVKHGLLAQGPIDLDRSTLAEVTRELHEYFRPVGPVERWLVDQISLLMVRIQRAVVLEKDCIAQMMQDRQETYGCPLPLPSLPGFPDVSAHQNHS